MSCGGSDESLNFETIEEKNEKPIDIIRSGEANGNRFFIDSYSKDTLFEGEIFYNCNSSFKSGYAWVSKLIDGVEKTGVINLQGEEVIPIKFTGRIGDYEEGGYFQYKEGGLIGYLDSSGTEVFPTIYHGSKGVYNGTVKLQGEKWKWGMVNMNGDVIVPFKYELIGVWRNERAVVKTKSGNSKHYYSYGYINEKGEEVIAPQYDFARSFEHNIALVEKDEKIWFIDRDNNAINKVVYLEYKEIVDVQESDYALSGFEESNNRFTTNEGYIIVKGEKGWGCIDTLGNEVITCEYDYVGIPEASTNSTQVSKDGKKGTFSMDKKEVTWN